MCIISDHDSLQLLVIDLSALISLYSPAIDDDDWNRFANYQ